MHKLAAHTSDRLDIAGDARGIWGPAEPRRATVQPWDGAFASGEFPAGARGSLFVSRPWLSALTATYGFSVLGSMLTVGGEVAAAIPYCDIEDIGGRRIVSLPFSDYADPFVGSSEDWELLVAPLLARRLPIRFRCLMNEVPLADGRFEKLNRAVWHGADLRRSEAEIWAGLASSARQNIRKAEGAGITIRAGTTLDDLRAFYDMHCRVRKAKYRLFAQPFAFFANLHAAFAPEHLIVLLAEQDGAPVAGILFLVHGDTLYYKFNASTDLGGRPNDLLVWQGMRLGRERGLARLDFGISDLDQPGLVRFKRKFAGDEAPVSELRWRPEGYADPRGEQGAAVLRRLTGILTAPQVPDELTRAVGDDVYRFFS